MKVMKVFQYYLVAMLLISCGGGNQSADKTAEAPLPPETKIEPAPAPAEVPPEVPPEATKPVTIDLIAVNKASVVFTLSPLTIAHSNYAKYINPSHPDNALECIKKNWEINFGSSDKAPQVAGLDGGLIGKIAAQLIFNSYLQFFRSCDLNLALNLLGMDGWNEKAHTQLKSGLANNSAEGINNGNESVQKMIQPAGAIRDRIVAGLDFYGVQVSAASHDDTAVKSKTATFTSAVTDLITKKFQEAGVDNPTSMLGLLANLSSVFRDSVFVFKDKEDENVYSSMVNFGELSTAVPAWYFRFSDHRLTYGSRDPGSVFFWDED